MIEIRNILFQIVTILLSYLKLNKKRKNKEKIYQNDGNSFHE